MRYEVVKDWTATYDAPIALRAGETIELTDRQDIWDGHLWLWAINSTGGQGWIPDSLLETIDGRPIAVEDYSAMELTCKRGETVSGLKETHGWALCRAADGRAGWVPLSHLEARAMPDSD